MTTGRNISISFIALFSCLQLSHGQSVIPAAGGNATGSGGTVSFTIGQIADQTFAGTNGTIIQGVQQPYEISVLTAVENTENITLEYKVFPNPTPGLLKLEVKPFDNENLRYRIFNIDGVLLQDKKIESSETEIQMNGFTPAIYFMRIILNNHEVKVFKIIKK